MHDTSRPEPVPAGPRILLVIAAGGVAGSLARYGLTLAIPQQPGHFPLATFVTNLVGCFAIGLLLARLGPGSHRLVRPFLATGVLGGFTTFSTFAVETEGLLRDHPFVALGYFFGTAAAAVCAAAAGTKVGGR